MSKKSKRRVVVSLDEAAPGLVTAMSTEIKELREANAALAAENDMLARVNDGLTKVTLREWDYDVGPSGSFVEAPYPYAIIKEFIDWMRTTSQWKESDTVQPVFRKFLRMQEGLTDARNSVVPVADLAPAA